MTATSALRGWETRREREEAVTVNLAPDEVALWERVKGGLKGTPSRRLEQFEQYAHEHPDEVVVSLQDRADAKLEALSRGSRRGGAPGGPGPQSERDRAARRARGRWKRPPGGRGPAGLPGARRGEGLLLGQELGPAAPGPRAGRAGRARDIPGRDIDKLGRGIRL